MRPLLHRLRRPVASLAAAGAVLSACATPQIDLAPAPTETAPQIIGASPADDRSAVLDAEVVLLTEVVTSARDAAAAAAAAADVAGAKRELERIVHLLSADPATYGRDLDGDGASEPPTVAPLLPGPAEAIGDDADYPDVFSRVLTAAREAGAAGASLVDVLRDPIAGDLGIWQGDAGAALDDITAAARRRTIEDVALAAAELPGAAAQALAYARWGLGRRNLAEIQQAGSRAAAHLQLAVDLLSELAS